MNRLDIENLLTQLSPFEQDLKYYYEKNGPQLSEADYLRLLKQHPVIPHDLAESFRLKDFLFSRPAVRKRSHIYTEDEYFHDFEDICIHKHQCYSPDFVHSHSFIEIAYVYAGTCEQTFLFTDKPAEHLRQQTGTLCILPPNLKHSIAVYDESVVLNILIRTSAMKQAITNLVADNHVLFEFFLYTLYENTNPSYLIFDTKQDVTIRELFANMMTEFCNNRTYSQRSLLLMTGLLFTWLQGEYSDKIRFAHSTSSGIAYIPRVLNIIHAEYATITVRELAARCAVSTSYLERIFRQNTQTTLRQTIQNVRMEKACELLSTTALPVQQIGENVGYHDVTQFIRIFKQYFHTTPLQYRKQLNRH